MNWIYVRGFDHVRPVRKFADAHTDCLILPTRFCGGLVNDDDIADYGGQSVHLSEMRYMYVQRTHTRTQNRIYFIGTSPIIVLCEHDFEVASLCSTFSATLFREILSLSLSPSISTASGHFMLQYLASALTHTQMHLIAANAGTVIPQWKWAFKPPQIISYIEI